MALSNGDKAQAIAHAEQALRAAEGVCNDLHLAETGKWVTWYFGERFVGVDASRDQLRVFLAGLRGEPPPPNRLGVIALSTGIEYPQLYQYQEPFLTNFPRFYPRGNPGTP